MAGSGLGQFVGDDTDRSLAVVGGEGPAPIRRSLERLFENQSVRVHDDVALDGDTTEPHVALLDGEDVVATAPLSTVYDSILGVNTDLYTTGARSLEDAALPDVLSELAGTAFTVQDYPASDREKLLFVAISRAIERRAFVGGEGKVRSSFQRLSRIDDERGTRTVYERLSEKGLDVHLYGQPGWTPEQGFDVTVHAGYAADFVRSWFVVYDPLGREHGANAPVDGEAADDESTTPAALVAYKRERSTWDGFWTFDPERVREVADYIEREL